VRSILIFMPNVGAATRINTSEKSLCAFKSAFISIGRLGCPLKF